MQLYAISNTGFDSVCLFGEGTIPAGFKLLESGISPSGVIIANYERAGEVKMGSLGLETPSEAELARRKRLKESG